MCWNTSGKTDCCSLIDKCVLNGVEGVSMRNFRRVSWGCTSHIQESSILSVDQSTQEPNAENKRQYCRFNIVEHLHGLFRTGRLAIDGNTVVREVLDFPNRDLTSTLWRLTDSEPRTDLRVTGRRRFEDMRTARSPAGIFSRSPYRGRHLLIWPKWSPISKEEEEEENIQRKCRV